MGPITDFIVTFRRDYGDYVLIEKEVEKICKNALQGYNILWQSRVKTPDSLEKKLRDRQKEYTDELKNLSDIKDLIGIRIILGCLSDFKYVEKAVDREFEIKDRSQHPKLGLNQGHSQSRFRGYGAFHFHVTRRVKSAEPYRALVIEIQVTSPFMWAFSQLEHDIVYKNLHGEPDEILVSHLEMLKGIANLGELAVQQFEVEGLRSLQQPNTKLDQRAVLVDLAAKVASKVHQLDADDKRCLQDLRVTDPEDDMERIQSTTHQLVESCCSWVFDDSAFRNWWSHDDCRFLWIHGDPGKGKTMIMVALSKEISRRLEGSLESNVLAYFFCQNSRDDLNTTVSVLRGLIFHLINQEKTLICHLREKYDSTGKKLFEGPNAQYALQGVLFNILNDQRLGHVYLMVDALDECDHKIHGLLDWITRNDSKWSSNVKWLTTSRNHPAFIERLGQDQRWHTSLELNLEHVSHAVATFIGRKVDELAILKEYNDELQGFLKESLREKADGTFLWVALVCKELEKGRRTKAKTFIEKIPRGLLPLYARMLEQAIDPKVNDDATQCQQILCSATVAFRPLRLSEMARFTNISDSAKDPQELEELISRCGSFLVMRQGIAYFVHQSAKDYLSTEGRSEIFSSGQAHEHAKMTRSCLDFMSKTLKRDVCSLRAPGILHDEVQAGTLNECLAYHVQYSCQYWVGHLHQVDQDGIGRVYPFFQRHFLHWLEAMSLTDKISDAILRIEKLNDILKSQGDKELLAFISDARRFVLEYRYVIETTPLQIYHSALLFAPRASLVKRMFDNEMPTWARVLNIEDSWTSCLQTLEGHAATINAIAFSPDGSIMVSASNDWTIRLWDPATGELRGTFEAHSGFVNAIAFSSDGCLLASASEDDENVRLWDPTTGGSRGILKGNPGYILAIIFSPKGSLLASAYEDNTIRLWNTATGELQSTLEGRSPIAFSPDGNLFASACDILPTYSHKGGLLASAFSENTIRLWNTATGELQSTLEGRPPRASSPDGILFAFASDGGSFKTHRYRILRLTFSSDSNLLASTSNKTITLWDPVIRQYRNTLEGHLEVVMAIAFSPDGSVLASASKDATVKIWDPVTGQCRNTLEGHTARVTAITFSPNGSILASVSTDRTVKIWDPVTGECRNTLKGHLEAVIAIAFSPDGSLLASASRDATVKIWDPTIQESQNIFEEHLQTINAITFSPDSNLLASASDDATVRLWDTITGECRYTFEGHSRGVLIILFSPDGSLLASASIDNITRLWDLTTGNCRGKFKGNSPRIKQLVFSPDSRLLASPSATRINAIGIWSSTTSECQSILEGHSGQVNAIVFSPDGSLLASASSDWTIRLWDLTTEESRGLFEGHSGVVSGVEFSPGGSLLASTSYDKTVRLWDLTTRQCRNIFEGHLSSVYAVVFSPDSALLASASRDENVRLWDIRSKTMTGSFDHRFNSTLSFNPDGTQLIVDDKIYRLKLSSSQLQPIQEESLYTMDTEKQWITRNGKKLLWLPPNYRPGAYACRDGIFALGGDSGRVAFIRFS